LTLGRRTTSGDREGELVETKDYSHVTKDKIKDVFYSYVGEILQIPPMISALKHRGKRLYSLARSGIEVNRQARPVIIKELSLLEFNSPNIKFYLKCSKGTYVRQLAEDIARDLDCVGYISEIQRQSVGTFNISEAVSLPEIDENCLRSYPL